MSDRRKKKKKRKGGKDGKDAESDEDKGKVQILPVEDANIRVDDFQMLEAVGKGGFGVVYRGLNVRTGATVAVKRVALHGIPPEELEGIEMEIKLLRNLSHPNIVKYVDAVRSDEYLNIILEFAENGALSGLLGKLLRHGDIEEQLVAVYTTQILEGLAYLHEQGVIHRDIKGANILCTKDGTVKLADFGVATKLNDSRKSDSVVGTPYWMAPEIIEMTGQQSSACDIWSVGCTVVELLTGKPPYFDLQQMPALFRIVQDEHPPLPDNVSPALEDFLMQCFQKDPLRRIDAKGLLRHPWLKSVVHRRAEEMKASMEQDRRAKETLERQRMERMRAEQAREAQSGKRWRAATVDHADDLDGLSDDDFGANDDASIANQLSRASVIRVGSSGGPQQESAGAAIGMMTSAQPIQSAWVEDDDDDDFDFGDMELDSSLLKKRSAPADVEEAEDVFADMEFDDGPVVDRDAKLTKQFRRVIKSLSHKEEEETILKACRKLTEMLSDNAVRVRALMTSYGVIPVMEMLESPSPKVVLAILKLVNRVVGKDTKFQQSMSLVGLIPAIIKFAGQGFPASIRQEAANFVRHFCYASDFTRKMFIACGGLPVLVNFMDEQKKYPKDRDLVYNAIDCIRHVFDITTNPRNDFCRLFCKYGLLTPMACAMVKINADKESREAQEYVRKAANIFFLFSQGDSHVKMHLARPSVLEALLKVLPELDHTIISLLIKVVKNVSMDPGTLEDLEAAGAIPALIPYLSSPHADISNQTLLAMYYLTTIKASRQEQAARSGIIPHLQRFIRENHPLKQFAFPLIFQLAKTSKRTRMELKKYNGVDFFLNLLDESYWRTHALEALALWLNDDPRRVEFILVRKTNVSKLVSVLRRTTKSVQFEKILVPFVKILTMSNSVNQALGSSHEFIDEIIRRLEKHEDSNQIRINLLKMLTVIYDSHPMQADLVERHNLVPVLQEVANDKSAVMVSPLAKELLEDITSDLS